MASWRAGGWPSSRPGSLSLSPSVWKSAGCRANSGFRWRHGNVSRGKGLTFPEGTAAEKTRGENGAQQGRFREDFQGLWPQLSGDGPCENCQPPGQVVTQATERRMRGRGPEPGLRAERWRVRSQSSYEDGPCVLLLCERGGVFTGKSSARPSHPLPSQVKRGTSTIVAGASRTS